MLCSPLILKHIVGTHFKCLWEMLQKRNHTASRGVPDWAIFVRPHKNEGNMIDGSSYSCDLLSIKTC